MYRITHNTEQNAPKTKDILFPIFFETNQTIGDKQIDAPIPIKDIKIISEAVSPFTVVKNKLSIIVLKNISRLNVVYKT